MRCEGVQNVLYILHGLLHIMQYEDSKTLYYLLKYISCSVFSAVLFGLLHYIQYFCVVKQQETTQQRAAALVAAYT